MVRIEYKPEKEAGKAVWIGGHRSCQYQLSVVFGDPLFVTESAVYYGFNKEKEGNVFESTISISPQKRTLVLTAVSNDIQYLEKNLAEILKMSGMIEEGEQLQPQREAAILADLKHGFIDFIEELKSRKQ